MLSRWLVFLILSTLMFAYTYTYDIPVALQEQLQEEYDLDNVEYALLFSVAAWPNCIIPILVGIVADFIGINIIIMIFWIITVTGNGIFVLGIYYSEYFLMLIGRSIYGIGIECVVMAQTPLIYEYFRGKELSLALGANISFSRLGSSVNQITSYYFYKQKGVLLSVTMGFILLIFCLFLLSYLIFYRVLNNEDLRTESNRKDTVKSLLENAFSLKRTTTTLINNNNNNNNNNNYEDDKSLANNYQSMTSLAVDDINNSLRSITTENTENSIIPLSDKRGTNKYIKKSSTIDDTESFKLSDLRSFDIRFWLIIINCCLIYGCVEPWIKIGGSFMQTVYKYSHQKANFYLTIPYITSGILTPFVGIYVDKYGNRCQCLLLSTFILICVHILFIESDQIPFNLDGNTFVLTCLILMGIAYSFFCGVIWPSFSIVVQPKTLATAYGIGVSGYNLTLGAFFFIVGLLAKDEGDEFEDIPIDKYNSVQYFLLSMAVLSTFTVALLWYFDRKKGNKLALPESKQVNNIKKSTMRGSIVLVKQSSSYVNDNYNPDDYET